jgi:AraC-like DNA-binding protein
MTDAPVEPEKTVYENKQAAIDYERIEKAIRFIEENFTRQPGLREIADAVHLSEFHFERMFSRWAGTTPQRFLRYLTKEYARQLLGEARDVAEVSYQVGLSGTGRLHDLFVTYEAMSPGEYKQQGKGLQIFLRVSPHPFGPCLIAVTGRGVCGLTFLPAGETDGPLLELRAAWPGAHLSENALLTQSVVEQIFAPVRTTGRQTDPPAAAGHQLPDQGVGSAAENSRGPRRQLRNRGYGRGQPQSRAGRGHRLRQQPDRVPDSLPPGAAKSRQPGRLPLGNFPQKGPPGLGSRPVFPYRLTVLARWDGGKRHRNDECRRRNVE